MRDYAVQQTSTLVNPFEIYPIINMEVIPFTNMAIKDCLESEFFRVRLVGRCEA